MARIIPDTDIQKLIGSVLLDAESERIGTNSIELRLGSHVKFHSTGEEIKIKPEFFLKVHPGESVTIVCRETIDFSRDAVNVVFPHSAIMGLITPTTTMMREGISQTATRVDPGFRGVLNWGLRNGSGKDLIVQHGEPLFKLTMFLLEGDEYPAKLYGERDIDHYQDSDGIVRSARKLPTDIPRNKIVSSSFSDLDPKKQLREAGHPFDHIGTELTTLQGRFEVVSSDVRMMKDEFNTKTKELSGKIESETKSLLDRVDILFDRKFYKIGGVVIGAIPIMYGAVTYLQSTSVDTASIPLISAIVGVLIIAFVVFINRKGDR